MLVPAPFAKAIRLFGHAARESSRRRSSPRRPRTRWFFRQRQQRQQDSSEPPDECFRSHHWRTALRASEPCSGCGSRMVIRDLGRAVCCLEGCPRTRAKAAWNSSRSRTSTPPLLPGRRRLISQQQRTTSGTTSRSGVVLSFNNTSRGGKIFDSRSLASRKTR